MKRYKQIVGGRIHDLVESYVSSIDFDRNIAKYVAMVMLAHVKELARIGVMPTGAVKAIAQKLVGIINTDGESLYEWISKQGEKYEDVFEALEIYLYNVVGPEAGYIALGRSRNDHIAAVLRLAIRDKVVELLFKILEIRKVLIAKSQENKEVLFPFFTHAQVAQCGSAAIYFLSYEQAFSDLWRIVFYALGFLSQNPLGSGASAGSILQISLDSISKNLCLDAQPLPPYYATGSRLFLLYTASALAMVMAEVGRFVEDMIMLNNVVPQGVKFPEDHISTSSIMPHKRNPVTLEIARAKVSKVLGVLAALFSLYKAVPYGYNLDFQEANVYFFDMVKEVLNTIEILKDFISKIELDAEALRKYISDKPCWSSDVAEYIAIKENRALREVYVELAETLKLAMKGDSTAISGFLSNHELDFEAIDSVIKMKPVEKNIDVLIGMAEKHFNEDSEKVKQVYSELTSCNEMLIRNFPQA